MNLENLLQQKTILETSLMFHDVPVQLDRRDRIRKQLEAVTKQIQEIEKKSLDKTKK